jgi:hypothetical protein
MAYYIFLKSLRRLEEFRKNPHVKIPPKSPSTNFQRLGKFKNPIFNSEILFLDFGPSDLVAHSAFGPANPLAALHPQAETVPRRPIQPARRSHLHGKYVFPFGSRLLSRPPLLRLSVNRAPAVSSIPHLQLPKLARAATAPRPPSAAQLHSSGATGLLPPRLHFHRTSHRFFSSLSTPQQPSHRAPTPSSLYHRHPSSST